ncbi:DUF885 domain-containing protein [Winogradskyella sp. UBA3174]|uniref:DUF885 domain-containing protein n=1 Tax=Winogradskyella sp. UBA3174 TaxID=1947785 RepID=UPI0025E052A8|nr:DUF885 domain-containing protein [Winogradskyella sp. UBA3174]|tara:strand:- start:18080 stop:19864 length:1785 start_codon:yes stop_codon:yes gene_type:complete
MKNILVLACILLSLTACKENTSTTNEELSTTTSDSFSALLNDYYNENLMAHPLEATFMGDNTYNNVLPNVLDDNFIATEKAYLTRFKYEVNTFEDSDLTESQQLSKAVLNWECDINLSRLNFTAYTPVDQMWSINLMIGQFASGASAQPFKTVEDYKNWLERVDGFLLWMQSAEDNMKAGIKAKHVLPKSLIVKVLPQLKALTTKDLSAHLFYKPITNLPDGFSEEDKTNLTQDYKSMVLDKIVPAFEQLHTFMGTDYMLAGRISSGISDIPNGEAYYKHQIKLYTTTDMSADEIHKLGLTEVARILSEMEKVKKQVGYEGDIISFFDHVRNKKELMPFTTPEEVIENFNAIYNKMKPQVDKLFNIQPKTTFEVRRTEAFREASASAEYNPGSIAANRPGVFYVPIPDTKTYNIYSDESLFLHEAIPGHHFQISLQQENENLPKFRKALWYSAYGEGWALYTESLGKELGLYTDPYQYFGNLSAEMHRAIRLVVDTGIHTKGWSREKAIEYSLKNEAESEESITREIERYMANPGQALSYKIGQLKILELRAKAEEQLGDKFQISEFHNQILEPGCIPLALLQEKINAWIESNK